MKTSSFKVYLNPANDYLTISINGKANVRLINLLGQEVGSQLINENGTIDISSLQEGNYFVQIETSTGLEQQQILILR